jgi:hypothetical protein
MNEKQLATSPGTFALGIACCLLGACSSETPAGHPAWGVGVTSESGNAGAGGAATSAGAGGALTGMGGAITGAAGASAGASDVGGAGATGGTGGTGGSNGGASGSAGTAGNADAGGMGGASTNCNGAALCDSFERATLGPDWTLDNSTSSTVIELVTTQAHTGMSSVHIKFGTTTLQSYITHKLPTTGMAYWGRAWIYTMLTPVGHSIYIEARVGAGNDKSGVRSLNTFDGKGSMGLNLESSDASKNSSTTLSMGKWVCYEWQVEGIGGMGDFTTWVDGVPMPAGKVANGVTATTPLNGTIPALTRQRIGIQRYDAGSAGEMWIDDVAIGDTRINCTP